MLALVNGRDVVKSPNPNSMIAVVKGMDAVNYKQVRNLKACCVVFPNYVE